MVRRATGATQTRRVIAVRKDRRVGVRAPRTYYAGDYKLVAVRALECPSQLCETPEAAAQYWREHITSHPYYSPDVESLVALLLNSRRRVIGSHLISTGVIDTILVKPLNVFRAAIVANAAALILMHNHPSGDPTPSDADTKITRDLIKGGQLLKIELLDHVIMGCSTPDRSKDYSSLRELGYFYS